MKTDEQDAKQGRSGRPVLMILVGGLILAAVVAIGLGLGRDETVDADISAPSADAETSTTQQ